MTFLDYFILSYFLLLPVGNQLFTKLSSKLVAQIMADIRGGEEGKEKEEKDKRKKNLLILAFPISNSESVRK